MILFCMKIKLCACERTLLIGKLIFQFHLFIFSNISVPLYTLPTNQTVRILIRVKDSNLVLLEGLTYQIILTEGKLIQVSNTDINES